MNTGQSLTQRQCNGDDMNATQPGLKNRAFCCTDCHAPSFIRYRLPADERLKGEQGLDKGGKWVYSPNMPQDQLAQSTKPAHPPGNNRGLLQAYNIRDFASSRLLELRETQVKSASEQLAVAKAVQCLGSVWKDACDRIRILRGRPLPGSLRPEPRKLKAKRLDPLPSDPTT